MSEKKVYYSQYELCQSCHSISIKEGWLIEKDKDGDGKIDSKLFVCEECYTNKFKKIYNSTPSYSSINNGNIYNSSFSYSYSTYRRKYSFWKRIINTFLFLFLQSLIMILCDYYQEHWVIVLGTLVLSFIYLWIYNIKFRTRNKIKETIHNIFDIIFLFLFIIVISDVISLSLFFFILTLCIWLIVLFVFKPLNEDAKNIDFILILVNLIINSGFLIISKYVNSTYDNVWNIFTMSIIQCLGIIIVGMILIRISNFSEESMYNLGITSSASIINIIVLNCICLGVDESKYNKLASGAFIVSVGILLLFIFISWMMKKSDEYL